MDRLNRVPLDGVALDLFLVFIMHPESFCGQLVRRVIAESVHFAESTGSRLLRSTMALDPSNLFQFVNMFLYVPPLVEVVRILLEFASEG